MVSCGGTMRQRLCLVITFTVHTLFLTEKVTRKKIHFYLQCCEVQTFDLLFVSSLRQRNALSSLALQSLVKMTCLFMSNGSFRLCIVILTFPLPSFCLQLVTQKCFSFVVSLVWRSQSSGMLIQADFCQIHSRVIWSNILLFIICLFFKEGRRDQKQTLILAG